MKPRSAVLLCLGVIVLTLIGQWAFTRASVVDLSREPDGVLYLALAHNLVAHGVYSVGSGPVLDPTYLRLPGYPLTIAGIFALCGDGNEMAVRDFQSVLATLTCVIVAALAFLWEPAPERRARAALVAFLLAALCPFTAIYSAIILAETLTIFLAMLLMLAATWAFRARTRRAATARWLTAGLLSGAVQLVRPESGLFAAAVGLTMVGAGLFGPRTARPVTTGRAWNRTIRNAVVFSCAFVVALAPWTLRNAAVFHVFAPLPPVNVTLPGEMSYRGFCAWYRTWADSDRYLEPIYWGMTDNEPASVSDLPPDAFDSDEEHAETVDLFRRYNASAVPADPASPRSGITPELDNAFARLAKGRAARSGWRYYVSLPLRRAVGLWFVSHSEYYDFYGSLFPLDKMKDEFQYHFWLPVFFGLTCVYTLLGLAGAWRLGRTRGVARVEAWRWLALILLVVLPRWAYLATLENTEPRYMVEIFPFLSVLGGLALAGGRQPSPS